MIHFSRVISCVRLGKQARFRFPGTPHPRVVEGMELPRHGREMSLEEVRGYFGVFSVYILPPLSGVEYPPVPYRTSDGRTCYGLCRTVSTITTIHSHLMLKCMETANQGECVHQDHESRGYHATYVSGDIEAALLDGYRLLRVYEVFDYGATKRVDLFSSMVKVPSVLFTSLPETNNRSARLGRHWLSLGWS